jgi:surface protein
MPRANRTRTNDATKRNANDTGGIGIAQGKRRCSPRATADAPIHPNRVNRTVGRVWSGVGYGIERAEPIRFSDETLRTAVQTWLSGRDQAMERYGHISTWDTTGVTDMSGLFAGSVDFNDPIGGWNTSHVTSMCGTFQNARKFNQPLNAWDTHLVRSMSFMFCGAQQFNQPLSTWDTSQVADMSFMFFQARRFNQPLRWDTSNVTDMSEMFYNVKTIHARFWETFACLMSRMECPVGSGVRLRAASADVWAGFLQALVDEQVLSIFECDWIHSQAGPDIDQQKYLLVQMLVRSIDNDPRRFETRHRLNTPQGWTSISRLALLVRNVFNRILP